jgi:uncharacterized hydrophobic protein (TIGR00271 family)
MRGLMSVSDRFHSVQDALGNVLGCDSAARATIVATMMRRDARGSVAYWLQLVVALGIATLGLVLSSSAVVIGAMLIAPLMGPIIALAMGLSVGSPLLVIRSTGRILLSVCVVVGGSAALTALLPFHELTPELAARTNPTVLDLITAAFCAVAGVYAALQPGTTTVTAAGTSIGISLVPPLCASGYGLGLGNLGVAKGAALLFLANLVAIVLVGTLAFIVTGFSRVVISEMEAEELSHEGSAPVSRRLARVLAELFASPGGPLMRVLLPFALLGVVYVPLRRALDEVVWQVQARREVAALLTSLPMPLVQSHLRVERSEIDLQLILLGDARDAARVSRQITERLHVSVGVEPHVEISIVPDAKALARLAETPSAGASTKAMLTVEPFERALVGVQERARKALRSAWPEATAGTPLSVWIDASSETTSLRLLVTHRGAPLDSGVRETLSRALGASLGTDVRLVLQSLDLGPWTEETHPADLVERVQQAWERARMLPSAVLCIAVPEPSDGGAATLSSQVVELRARFVPASWVVWTTAASVHVEIALDGCREEPRHPSLVSSESAADAGG